MESELTTLTYSATTNAQRSRINILEEMSVQGRTLAEPREKELYDYAQYLSPCLANLIIFLHKQLPEDGSLHHHLSWGRQSLKYGAIKVTIMNDLKRFGIAKVFSELLADLKSLETDGINVDGETVKGGLYCIAGDNLGSHFIGGFTENFSRSQYFCRWHFFIANMSDSERTFLDVVIMEVLPQLPAENKNILEEHLQSIGVETYDDLRFVTEADLMTALRPVQARKLLSAWKRKYQTPENSSPSSVEALPTQSLSSLSVSPRSSSSTSASSPGLDTQWDDNFEIPWSKFPEEVTHALERGKRPGPKLRRQMVRIVVTEMMEKCPHVGKKHSTDVARKMVAKYPNSLQDVIEGDIVGTGYHSLVKQLQNRIENVRRTSTPKIRKRKHQTDDSDHTDEIPLEERAAMQDIYGCIKWNVKFLPCEETQESQQQKMEKLKVMFQHSDANPEEGKRLLNYMTTVCVNKSKKILQTYARLQRMRGQQSGCSDDVKEMILLLLSYFDEKEESMFFYVEDTCLAEEVQLEQVPLTPTIIVCGKSVSYLSFLIALFIEFVMYMLSLDRNLINTNISSFISALCLMFGSYYCFNIHYPSELASTLEFLQRCFFSINPEKGTKVENKNLKRRLNVNPRVLTLIQELADHEWREA
ncbi:hypothetical protein L3Q82_020330 [Scortum barcoo]|uniref:Uncharacterized protein n=2 Tax=Scortum barcoo TaxID=214431 RepID=A0ACB8V795_9TELE|nr:hypothetical protein L3Q82_020330 [Scortum barcoo]